jgi:chromosomal replication initiator protein
MQSKPAQTMQGEINRLRRVIVNQDREIVRLKNIINYRAIEHDIIPMSLDCVMHHVCVFFHLTREMLIEQNRSVERVRARMVMCYIAQRRYSHTYRSIGIALGHRDHSTIMSACEKADFFVKKYNDFKYQVDLVINAIEAEFNPIQPHNES